MVGSMRLLIPHKGVSRRLGRGLEIFDDFSKNFLGFEKFWNKKHNKL